MRSCIALVLVYFLLLFAGCEKEENPPTVTMQLTQIRVGGFTLNLSDATQNNGAPTDQPIIATFSAALDAASVSTSVILKIKDGAAVPLNFSFLDNGRTFSGLPTSLLEPNKQYELVISSQLRGKDGETFPGLTIIFGTVAGQLTVVSLKFDGTEALTTAPIINISRTTEIEIHYPHLILQASTSFFGIVVLGSLPANYSIAGDNMKVIIQPIQPLCTSGIRFGYRTNLQEPIVKRLISLLSFYTKVDPTPKFQ